MVGCADARVPVEMLFLQSANDLFVVASRTVGLPSAAPDGSAWAAGLEAPPDVASLPALARAVAGSRYVGGLLTRKHLSGDVRTRGIPRARFALRPGAREGIQPLAI